MSVAEILIRRIGRRAYANLSVAVRPMWQGTKCLFVLSTGRTGTDTLHRLLGLSNGINAHHEPHPQLMHERKRARWDVAENPDLYKEIFIRARGNRLLDSMLRKEAYAETSARLTFFAPVIAELLPNAQFIYIHRHPAEIVVSGMRRGWYVDHPADPARIEPIPGEVAYEMWSQWHPFQKICWYWDAYNRFSLAVREQIGVDRVLTISAEQLFEGTSVPAIFERIGVAVPPKERVQEVLARRHNAQTESSFPAFENWTRAMKRDLDSIAGETMEKLGYQSATLV